MTSRLLVCISRLFRPRSRLIGMAVKDPLNYWQDGSITHRSDRFYEFCDALEVKDGKNAPYHGWGLNYAFEAWGRYWNKTLYPSCTF